VVIEKGYEPDWQGWMGHYLTLIGYDEEIESFTSMDTFLGPWDDSGRLYHYDEIERYWSHFNNTFLVVYPPEQEEALMRILGPVYQDNEAMWLHAAENAQQQIEEDAQDAFAWFNLGSSLTELALRSGDAKQFAAAAGAFDQARLIGLPPRMLWYQFSLYEAYLANDRAQDVLTLTTVIRDHQGGDKVEETFYYRGLAQEKRSNLEDAAFNYRRALEIRPDFPEAQAALERLSAR
jgi:tetratricopeptide (TPR) repeat protein